MPTHMRWIAKGAARVAAPLAFVFFAAHGPAANG